MAGDRSAPKHRSDDDGVNTLDGDASSTGDTAGGTGDADLPTAPSCRTELLDIAGGDLTLAGQLEQSLRHLAGAGRDNCLAELADDVLHGRVPLRTAAASGAYGHLLGDAARNFRSWYDRLSSHDRAELAAPSARFGGRC